jgi:hypothetical protein
MPSLDVIEDATKNFIGYAAPHCLAPGFMGSYLSNFSAFELSSTVERQASRLQ